MATLKEIYQAGFKIGSEIAKENASREIEHEGEMFDVCEDPEGWETALVGLAIETESEHYRQFSPFEWFADELNRRRDADRAWEKYEKGVYEGASAAASQLVRENWNDD